MIYIPFELHRHYVSGIVTFMKNLQAYLDAKGYAYTETFQAADAIFFPVQYDPHQLDVIKKSGGQVIQRLDGIYHQKKHGSQYQSLNKPIREIYAQYADFVIFQSEYSCRQCFEMFGERQQPTYRVIPNGVDKKTFYPAPVASSGELQKVSFITTGGFRNKDMLEPITNALDQLTATLDFELIVVGPSHHDAVLPYLKKKYVRHVGEQDSQKLAALLRASHIFLYSIANPACPNSVLEAISCGLPVVGFDSGAMRELCHFSEDLLAHVSDDIFQVYEDFDHRKLQEKIVLAVTKYPYYREKALAHRHLYAFEDTGAAYVEAFDQVQQEAQKTFDVQQYRRLRRRYALESGARRWYGAVKNKLRKKL